MFAQVVESGHRHCEGAVGAWDPGHKGGQLAFRCCFISNILLGALYARIRRNILFFFVLFFSAVLLLKRFGAVFKSSPRFINALKNATK